MTNLEAIKEKLLMPSGYAFIPKTHIDVPLPFPEWEIQDANGVGTGSYYSPLTLSKELGSFLQLVDVMGGNWFIMRYGLDWDTVDEVSAYLVSIGLVDVRRNADGTLTETKNVDYTALAGNEFMIVPAYQAKDIPK